MHQPRGKRIYIAGPLGSQEKWAQNAANAVEAWSQLTQLGYYPYCPHMSIHLHEYSDYAGRLDYETWLDIDFAWLDVCDYLLRLPGHSPGADREVEYAKIHRITVVHSVNELVELVNKQCPCNFCAMNVNGAAH